ncbi:hypothetical protein FRB90_008037 [Tulasnella sp. 427]|nr:hypothetical protein FRB90_008037 [Tulasnella sp. 427]
MAVYRLSYSRLGLFRSTLRSLKANVPIVHMSATLPPAYLNYIHSLLQIDPDALLINLGNHRPELSPVVMELRPDSSHRQLARILSAPLEFPDKDAGIQAPKNLLPKVVIYVDDIKLITELFWWLRM